MSETSKYSKYLPAYMRQEAKGTAPDFLDRFLLPFEKALSGRPEDAPLTDEFHGIGEILDRIQDYFDPNLTPPQFLPYLARWVAWELPRGQDDWNRSLDKDPETGEDLPGDDGKIEVLEDQHFPLDRERNTRVRKMIQSIASLYRLRGTRRGLEEYLAIYSGVDNVHVREFHELMQVGVTSTVGENTIVGNKSYYFQVEVTIQDPRRGVVQEYEKAIRSIMDQEKPAHTHYDIVIYVKGFQLGVHSTIGKDSLIGGKIVRD